jgi:hypothetical protein
MWEHYKSTFIGMQITMAMVTFGVWSRTHLAFVSATFFLTMQLASLLGSAWAARLKRKIRAGGPMRLPWIRA